MVKGCLGNADTTRVSQCLQAGRNVYSIAVNAAVLLYYVPKIHPNTKHHTTVLRKFGIPCLELVLGRDRTLNRIHYTRKLGQYIVPRGVYDSSAVLLDEFSHDFPIGGEGLDRLGLILAHEATVPFHIRTQNSRELTLEGLC